MRTLFLSVVFVVAARGADTPLSAVLIEGEGWQNVGEKTTGSISVPTDFSVRRDDKGIVGVYRGKAGPLAIAPEGESWGTVAMSPRKGKLVVAVPSHHHLWVFQIAEDGSLFAREKCYTLRRETLRGPSQVKAMTFDSKGRLWVAMPGGVQYFDEEMRFSGQLSRPESQPVEDVWLRGDELFITSGGKTWKRKVNASAPK